MNYEILIGDGDTHIIKPKEIKKLEKLFSQEEFDQFLVQFTDDLMQNDKIDQELALFWDRHPDQELFEIVTKKIFKLQTLNPQKAVNLKRFYEFCEQKIEQYRLVYRSLQSDQKDLDKLKSKISKRDSKIGKWEPGAQRTYDILKSKEQPNSEESIQKIKDFIDPQLYLLRAFIRFFKSGLLDVVDNVIEKAWMRV